MDTMSSAQRSATMRSIKGKNTKPEMIVRRLLHASGYRYRVHCREIPGTPDIAFTKRRKVIFIHGCFWHRHAGCARASTPKTNASFWENKFLKNIERDKRVQNELKHGGWSFLIIWECEIRNLNCLKKKLQSFLGQPKAN